MLDKSFDFMAAQAEFTPKWEESGLTHADPSSGKTPFTIMMPPPNVTGSLHVGHALVMTLQDLMVRYNRMKGKDVLWQPGTDHASIPVDVMVTKQLESEGLTKEDVGREEFLKRCWAQKEQSGGAIMGQLRELAATPDWTRERFTMDDDYMKSVITMFVKMYKDGLIYKDTRLVNWDPKAQTAISDIEVDHKDVKGKMYHVKYMYEDGSGSISIATTRPETILADGAIAVHPDDERYKDVVGKFVVVPVCNRIIPIVADEYVKADFGSGAVKITAAHDYNDFEVYKRHKDKGIPLINLMNKDGTMNENCPEDYQGLDRFAARDKIIADLDELEYLEKIEDHVHQVPLAERTGVVVEPYLTDQWYVDAAELGKPALKAVEDGTMEFVPKQWENTYYSWMRNLEPWCISRQLWWGYQIPAYYGPDDKIFVAETAEEAQAEADAHYGEPTELVQDNDILDTWFSSGLWPFATLGWPEKTAELDKYYPGDVLVTGFDIIFFWVVRMMMMGMYAMDGQVPFHKVYMHGLVRDSKGAKMSKSKGNVLDPLDLSEKYGTDALRFTLCAMCGQGRDIKLSEQRLEGYRNFGTKLWNAARYCEMNDALPKAGFDPSTVKNSINQWMIDEVMGVVESLDTSMDQYRFNDAANGVYHFIWGTFCDWYLEFTKPLMDTDYATETKATTGWVLNQIITILNPFMPYITEELHRQINVSDELLLGGSWPELNDAYRNTNARAEITWLQQVISEVRSVRTDMNVPASAKLDVLFMGADDQTQGWLETHEAIISNKEIAQNQGRLSNEGFVSKAQKKSLKNKKSVRLRRR